MATAAEQHPKLYGRRWRKARKQFLTEHPLCAMCERLDKITASAEVDHIIKHDGDPVLFWDVTNWQALCATCHRTHKAREERSGRVMGCTLDGTPLARL